MCDQQLHSRSFSERSNPIHKIYSFVYYIDNTHYGPKQLEVRGGGKLPAGNVIFIGQSMYTEMSTRKFNLCHLELG